ncbi:hypothetical protein A2U01_0002197 [Trifolium medium]|uniref:Uncharacterized protein n=1 Tax=Trifolium medium TaxID=97028 RepID=A0A392M278_9FABA|nr:hypothetical protein [Trifolium medium]
MDLHVAEMNLPKDNIPTDSGIDPSGCKKRKRAEELERKSANKPYDPVLTSEPKLELLRNLIDNDVRRLIKLKEDHLILPQALKERIEAIKTKFLIAMDSLEEDLLEPEPMEVNGRNKGKVVLNTENSSSSRSIHPESASVALELHKELASQRIKQEALEDKMVLVAENQKSVKESQVALELKMDSISSNLTTLLTLFQSNQNP